jgi:hypothetical protein
MSITAVYVLAVCACISYICTLSCVLCSYRLLVSGDLGDTCIECSLGSKATIEEIVQEAPCYLVHLFH